MKISSSTSQFARLQLAQTSRAITRGLRAISSGQAPAQNAATASLVQNLSTKVRSLAALSLSLNQDQSLLTQADAGVRTQLDILGRIQELTLKAQGALTSVEDRRNISKEIVGLLAEFDQTAKGIKSLKLSSSEFLPGGLPSTSSRELIKNQEVNGSFTSIAQNGISPFISSMVAGDLDGDGYDELMIQSGAEKFVYIYQANSSGRMSLKQKIASPFEPADSSILVVADVNGDGLRDLVGRQPTTGQVSAWLGRGDGTLSAAITSSEGGSALIENSISVADFNKDGFNDLLVGSEVLLSNGDGSFRSVLTTGAEYAAVGDFDGDGNMDILSALYASNEVELLRGDGQGNFTSPITATLSDVVLGIYAGNFDSDSATEFLVKLANSDVRAYNDLSSGLSQMSLVDNGPITVVGVKDLNRDGFDDLILTEANGPEFWMNNGTGSFRLLKTGSASPGSSIPGDFNGDGLIDFFEVSSISFSQASSVSSLSRLDFSNSLDTEVFLEGISKAQESLMGLEARISVALASLESRREFYDSQREVSDEARSLIADVDYSKEVAELTRNQILQQAQIAVMAQSNVQQRSVLALLDSLNR